MWHNKVGYLVVRFVFRSDIFMSIEFKTNPACLDGWRKRLPFVCKALLKSIALENHAHAA